MQLKERVKNFMLFIMCLLVASGLYVGFVNLASFYKQYRIEHSTEEVWLQFLVIPMVTSGGFVAILLVVCAMLAWNFLCNTIALSDD